jgi:hypothetical protein
MPNCFMPKRVHTQDALPPPDAPAQEWREPPGYLGEAVRRAKRISRLARPGEMTPPKN